MKQTVYIIGPTTYRSKLNLSDFNVIEGMLDKQGFDSVKPHDLFEDMDNNILSQKEQMQRRFDEIDKHPLCIVMPEYHLCNYARAEVYHAKKGGKEVVHFIDWKIWMKRKAEMQLKDLYDKYGASRTSKVA